MYSRISHLRREKFLFALERFIRKHLRAEVSVLCSQGTATPGGGRRVVVSNASHAGAAGGERLVINIRGLDGGALIPMISTAEPWVTLEGVISAASDRAEIGADPALDFLAAAAPLIAQWFANLKHYAAYIAACSEEGESARVEMVNGSVRSISARQIGRLMRGLEARGRALRKDAAPKRRGDRTFLRIALAAAIAVTALVLSAVI